MFFVFHVDTGNMVTFDTAVAIERYVYSTVYAIYFVLVDDSLASLKVVVYFFSCNKNITKVYVPRYIQLNICKARTDDNKALQCLGLLNPSLPEYKFY